MPNAFKNSIPDIAIKPISGLDTISIRHAVLRKGKPVEACKIIEDHLESTYHFGLFYRNKLVGVCTFVIDKSPYFKEVKQYRLRAMAILENYQGLHFGKHLLMYGVNFLKEKKTERLWFNARINAVGFYKKNGFETIGSIFKIPSIGNHYMMHKKL